MISMVTLDGRSKEIRPLENIIYDLAATLTEDKWNIDTFDSIDAFSEFVEEHPLIDMSCYDVAIEGAVDRLIQFRHEYEQASIVLIADPSISPLEYLKPGIRPDSLLMRPLSREAVRSVLIDFISEYIKRQQNEGPVKSFVYDTKEGKISIPYNDIYYFEAREKKIFIRTLSDEFGLYDTIENIQDNIPEQFVRCHRSFIVNTDKIRKIMLSQSIMELTEDFEVPLSRSYKPLFKEFGK